MYNGSAYVNFSAEGHLDRHALYTETVPLPVDQW